MNRDFEKEYIEFAQNEIPDLWDRIEAGLNEKSAPETKKTNKLGKIISWKKYAALAAAVLCAVIVIPAFMLTGPKNSSSAYDTSVPQQNCETAKEGFEEEACETAEEESGIMADYEEAAAAASEEDFGDMAPVTENSTSTAVKNDDAGALAESEAASGAIADLEEKRSMQVLSHIMVQVTETEDTGDRQETSSLEGMVYTVIILQDTSGTFFEGEQIEIYVPDEFSSTMSAGKEFEIDLICKEDGEYPFMVGQVYVE